MLRAKNQADNCDVGHAISVYADWTRAGGHYQPFPDPSNLRIPITELHDAEIRERLRLIWTDPLAPIPPGALPQPPKLPLAGRRGKSQPLGN